MLQEIVCKSSLGAINKHLPRFLDSLEDFTASEYFELVAVFLSYIGVSSSRCWGKEEQ